MARMGVHLTTEICQKQCGAKCCKAGGTLFFQDGSKLVTPIGQPCPFLSDDDLCKIYEHRPEQCRSFPQGPHKDCLLWPLEDLT